MSTHSTADLTEATSLISQIPKAATAAHELEEEVFRFKPQIMALADSELALRPTNWHHLALTAIPSSQSHLTNAAGFIGNHLMISGQSLRTADGQKRSDTNIKLELN